MSHALGSSQVHITAHHDDNCKCYIFMVYVPAGTSSLWPCWDRPWMRKNDAYSSLLRHFKTPKFSVAYCLCVEMFACSCWRSVERIVFLQVYSNRNLRFDAGFSQTCLTLNNVKTVPCASFAKQLHSMPFLHLRCPDHWGEGWRTMQKAPKCCCTQALNNSFVPDALKPMFQAATAVFPRGHGPAERNHERRLKELWMSWRHQSQNPPQVKAASRKVAWRQQSQTQRPRQRQPRDTSSTLVECVVTVVAFLCPNDEGKRSRHSRRIPAMAAMAAMRFFALWHRRDKLLLPKKPKTLPELQSDRGLRQRHWPNRLKQQRRFKGDRIPRMQKSQPWAQLRRLLQIWRTQRPKSDRKDWKRLQLPLSSGLLKLRPRLLLQVQHLKVKNLGASEDEKINWVESWTNWAINVLKAQVALISKSPQHGAESVAGKKLNAQFVPAQYVTVCLMRSLNGVRIVFSLPFFSLHFIARRLFSNVVRRIGSRAVDAWIQRIGANLQRQWL